MPQNKEIERYILFPQPDFFWATEWAETCLVIMQIQI